jgi:hypothetical protein
MVKLAIITPHGGDNECLQRTLSSVRCLRTEGFFIEHIIVANNGSAFSCTNSNASISIQSTCLDINPVSSRAEARNTALNYLEAHGFDGYVHFLDSGDLIMPELLDALHENHASQALWGNALILDEIGERHKLRLPAKLKLVVNPFYLGAVLVRFDTIKSVRFRAGRKEDWKFWLEAFERSNPTRVDQIFYKYVIKSRTSHLNRKVILFKDQWSFFRSYLGHNVLTSLLKLILHYLINTVVWGLFNTRRR